MGGQGQRDWPVPSKVGPTGHRGDQRHSRKSDSISEQDKASKRVSKSGV